MKKALVTFVFLLACGPAALAGDWSIGTNFGLTVISPDDGDRITAVAVPAAVGGLQPGLRVGYAFDEPRHELYADIGVLLYSTESYTNNALELTANYQWNFAPERSLSPFATAGFGFLFQRNELGNVDASGTAAVFGLGVGLRRAIADRAGSLRGELRFDRMTEAKDGSVVLVPEGNAFTLKLGFDLWGRR